MLGVEDSSGFRFWACQAGSLQVLVGTVQAAMRIWPAHGRELFRRFLRTDQRADRRLNPVRQCTVEGCVVLWEVLMCEDAPVLMLVSGSNNTSEAL